MAHWAPTHSNFDGRTVWEALEDANIDPVTLAGTRTGVFVGLSSHDYELRHAAKVGVGGGWAGWEEGMLSHLRSLALTMPLSTGSLQQASHMDGVDARYGIGMAPAMAAGRVSYFLNLAGPALTLDTACSSSLVAIHTALRSLRAGEVRPDPCTAFCTAFYGRTLFVWKSDV